MASKKPAKKEVKKVKGSVKANLTKSVAMPVIGGGKMKSAPAKNAKGSKVTPATAVAAPNAEGDEDEDFEEGAQAGGAARGGSEAALNAAITQNSSSGLTQKNFRNHPDMENFFRFIHENDLRLEALEIIDEIILTRNDKKKLKAGALAQ